MDDDTTEDGSEVPAAASPEPGKLARSGGAAVAGAAGVYLWASDPGGAAIATALLTEPAAMLVQRAVDELRAARRRTQGAVAALAAHHRGIPVEELLLHTRETPESEELLFEALEGAAATTDERKIAGFARAIANGLAGDRAKVDESRNIVRALAAIETPHVRELMNLPGNIGPRPASSDPRFAVRGRGQGSGSPRQAFKQVGQASVPLLALLEAQGLARTNATEIADEQSRWSVEQAKYELAREVAESQRTSTRGLRQPAKPESEPGWCRTSFGDTCASYLRERATLARTSDDSVSESVVVVLPDDD